MEFNKEASNPMLVGAMNLLKAEDTPEHRKLFAEELAKATFLAPVSIDPAPTVNEKGDTVVQQGAKIQFPMLNSRDGKKFYVLYTDKRYLEEALVKEGNPTPPEFRDNYAAIKIEEIGSMFIMPGPGGMMNPAEGAIINPFNEGLIVGKDMAMGYFKSKAEAIRAKMMKEKEEPGKVIRFPGKKED